MCSANAAEDPTFYDKPFPEVWCARCDQPTVGYYGKEPICGQHLDEAITESLNGAAAAEDRADAAHRGIEWSEA